MYFEAGKSRDKDNVSGGARKCILDAFVQNGVLGNDDWSWIAGFDGEEFSVDKDDPRIIVVVRGS